MSQSYLTENFSDKIIEPPAWKDKVSRWSQLDGPAFALTEFYWKNRSKLSKPTMILLASPGASNATDRRFVQAGASSPSLFVHTLPNIRCSPLCQVMEWSGPVLCVQDDPQTVKSGLRQAEIFLDRENPVIWVLGVETKNGENTVHCYQLSFEEN